MAKTRPSSEVQPLLDDVNQKISDLESQKVTAIGTARERINTELATLNTQRKTLEKELKAAQKAEGEAKKAAEQSKTERADLVAQGQETIRIRQERVDIARKALEERPNDAARFAKYQEELGNLYTKFREYSDKGVDLPRTVELVPGKGFRELATPMTPKAETGASIMDSAQLRAVEQAALNQQTDPDSVRVVSTKTIERNGYTIKVETMSDGAVKETTLGKVGEVTPTPTGGGTGGTKTGKAKTGTDTVTAQAATDWEATFRQTFPSRAWILDEVDRTKYPQLFSLLKKAHDEKYYTTPEGQQRFLAELEAVDYYKELAVSGKVRDIKAVVGDLGFESTDFGRFVNQAINFGWSGDRLKQETYKEVFRRNPDGTYANPTAVTRTTKGADYLSVGNIAKAYFNTASDAGIESVLTGSITNEDFARQQREIAKTRYGHLSNLIDQGVTLEDLSASYKSAAAKLLELDPNTIDMSQAQYEVALAYGGENGQKRTMTTGEWERLLRTDSRYGWEKTENAKDEARSLATNIAQAFGRIL
jgi:hypothetical protein